jgi:hypothetical protein
VARLTALSLALGMLTDRGAEALPGVQVNLEERQEPRGEMGFYVAVSE